MVVIHSKSLFAMSLAGSYPSRDFFFESISNNYRKYFQNFRAPSNICFTIFPETSIQK